MTNTITVKNLHVYYGASHALQGVNLAFNEGIHAVLGRNGMGKTTLCKAIMGLVSVRSGSIHFNGHDITGLKPNRIASYGVGYTPQGRKLWPSLSVDEHLRLCAAKSSAWTVERIYETFPRLAERRTNGGAQLSGGEQQMLAISRALLPGPKLLVLDEPTEGLAPVIVDQVVGILKQISAEGDVSVLLVEQNLSVATEVSNDISIMVNGQIQTVVDAKELAARKDLQQQLLGVGRYDELPPTTQDQDGQPNHEGYISNPLEVPEVSEQALLPPPKNDYTPPERWTSEKWKYSDNVEKTSPAASTSPSIPAMNGYVLVAGTFDTKLEELNFLKERLLIQQLSVRTVDLSTSGKVSSADIPPHHVAAFHPEGAGAVMTGDRGSAVTAMTLAFENWIRSANGIVGIISAAGSGGTALATPAMRVLPIGIPKIMISTVASGDVGEYVGPSDIMMMYSVTDVQGLNRISSKVLANGSDALAGAVQFQRSNPVVFDMQKSTLGLTMFGVTTTAIQALTNALEDRYECLVFHATGVGGRSMEKLVDSGMLSGALDITTTEVCDMMMGGVFPATEDRFSAFIRNKIPYVGSVGALDMVNWHAPNTVPEKYADRLFYEHNPQVTLMRTTLEENIRMGRWIAGRLNEMSGPVRFILPLQGVSALDAEGQAFYDPEARQALYNKIRSTFKPAPDRKLIEVDCNINDQAFTQTALKAFGEVMGTTGE